MRPPLIDDELLNMPNVKLIPSSLMTKKKQFKALAVVEDELINMVSRWSLKDDIERSEVPSVKQTPSSLMTKKKQFKATAKIGVSKHHSRSSHPARLEGMLNNLSTLSLVKQSSPVAIGKIRGAQRREMLNGMLELIHQKSEQITEMINRMLERIKLQEMKILGHRALKR